MDVVIRPEDVEMTTPENGQIKGNVQAVNFKGMHYDITVQTVTMKFSKSTKNAGI